MFYEYQQNNSGGSYRAPAITVYIEAPSADVADAIAETKGLYFNGKDDCSCCGNRWHETYSEGVEQIEFQTYMENYYQERAKQEGVARFAIFYLDGSHNHIGGVHDED